MDAVTKVVLFNDADNAEIEVIDLGDSVAIAIDNMFDDECASVTLSRSKVEQLATFLQSWLDRPRS